jgi:hypothetical protein
MSRSGLEFANEKSPGNPGRDRKMGGIASGSGGSGCRGAERAAGKKRNTADTRARAMPTKFLTVLVVFILFLPHSIFAPASSLWLLVTSRVSQSVH